MINTRAGAGGRTIGTRLRRPSGVLETKARRTRSRYRRPRSGAEPGERREGATRLFDDTPAISQLTKVISQATAPAFMLGGVAGFLSILISRLERIVDRRRALGSPPGGSGPSPDPLRLDDRVRLLNNAIYFCVLSALSTALLLIVAFALAFFDARHEKGVAILFVAALLLLMASLIQLAREVRIALRTMHLD